MATNGAKALFVALVFVLYNASELVAGDIVDVSSRKLLTSEGDAEVNRHGRPSCNGRDISIFQSQVSPEAGMPTFLVEIGNLCSSNCTKYDVHLSCGWFSSVKLINPEVFRRLRYNDCLVNGGRSIEPGHLISFRNIITYGLQRQSIYGVYFRRRYVVAYGYNVNGRTHKGKKKDVQGVCHNSKGYVYARMVVYC